MNCNQSDVKKLTSAINDEFYKEKSIDDLTFELHKILDKQINLSEKWLSRFNTVEALRLILSICHKSKIDLNQFIQISITK